MIAGKSQKGLTRMSKEGSPTESDAPPQESDSDAARLTEGMEELLDQAEANLAKADTPPVASSAGGVQPFQLDELGDLATSDESSPIEILSDVDLDLRIELGRTHMRLHDVLGLRSGSVVALDRLAGDPVDIFVNDRLVARGEVLVLNENFCVRVTELVSDHKA